MASCNMCRNGLTALKRPCPNGCKAEVSRPAGQWWGLNWEIDPTLPPDIVEFRHADGRVDRFKIKP